MRTIVRNIVILLILCYIVFASTKERYTLPSARASDQAKMDLNGKIKLVEKSVLHTAWANVTIRPKHKSEMEKFAGVFNPKETLIFTGRPKYKTQHAVIVGKPFTFSIEARSLQEAQAAVNKRAAEELEGINYVLRAANLL